MTLWGNADQLITTVANNNNNTIVVAHSVGPAIVDAWIEHPNVTALIWAGVPGQEAGNSIVDVLYGDYNPSGRLPYTLSARNNAPSPPDNTGNGPSHATPIDLSLLTAFQGPQGRKRRHSATASSDQPRKKAASTWAIQSSHCQQLDSGSEDPS